MTKIDTLQLLPVESRPSEFRQYASSCTFSQAVPPLSLTYLAQFIRRFTPDIISQAPD